MKILLSDYTPIAVRDLKPDMKLLDEHGGSQGISLLYHDSTTLMYKIKQGIDGSV